MHAKLDLEPLSSDSILFFGYPVDIHPSRSTQRSPLPDTAATACPSSSLPPSRRDADQSSSRAMELEHKVAVLEVECASLHQELQEMEARNRRAQKKPSDEANQVLQKCKA